jgi:hypothetical protein
MMAGQNIKTNYKTPTQAQKDSETLKKHADRVAQNKVIREEARDQSAIGKVKRAVKTVRDSPTTKRVGQFVKDRSEGIAHEMQPGPERASRRSPPPMSRLPQVAQDPFGVGGFGSMHRVMQSDPFHELPRRNPVAPPKKKRRRSPRRESSGGSGMDMMGIPDHMKWMF